ncbi:magnesium transporter MgtE N-terminal domain-containing protein, partial [Klebsiella pneumoniae]|uniref:magnesium transporter MgtE N-terminal domain-containing protein n=1 Tax=Klebsiella pneumoniae TaxID=573 RepID=UPI00272F1F31
DNCLENQFKQYIEANDLFALRRAVENWSAPDIAALIETLPDGQAVILFRVLRRQHAAQVFEVLTLKHQQALIQALAG